MNTIKDKYKELLRILSNTKGALIAFSGGVDSSLLLYAAKEALGNKVIAASIATPYVPDWEQAEAREIARNMGVKHIVIELPFPEELRMNPPEHCYTCKRILFEKLIATAAEHGIDHVLEGTNIDDLSDYRPGIKALRELEITSPFVEAGLNKQDIRDLSREFGLPTWNKPSFACLLSRMPVGGKVTEQALRQVENAEVFLMKIGFPSVRVRHHGDVARIEIPCEQLSEFIRANEKHSINEQLKGMGYWHVALDLGGYSMGSLNREPSEE